MKSKINNSPKILISGGGTGGHIFPALSIARELRRRMPQAEILFVGAEGRMEMERVPADGFAIEGLPVAGFDRRRLWRNFGVLLKLQRSLRKAHRILSNFKPDVAIGVGGYASGPMLRTAQKHGVPTLLQEQNSYPGVTNKLLAPHANCICVAYPGMDRYFPADKIIMTGNPVRRDLSECKLTRAEAKISLGMSPDRPMILVLGGSLGARTVNQSVINALPEWNSAGVNVMWQCGKLYLNECAPIADHYPNVKVAAFISDMAAAYRAADLVVARAGASTISELALLGKAAVLIPSPNVAEDHQRHNAESLTERDAATMILDADAPAMLGQTVLTLLSDPGLLQRMEQNILTLARPDSTERVVDHVLELIAR